MKQLTILFCLVLCALMAQAAEKLNEDFSSLPTGSLSGDHTLPSGIWTFNNMNVTTSNGVKSLKFNSTGSTVATPALDNVEKISLGYRSGGSNKNVVVSYSTDNGSSWTELDRFVIKSSSSSFATYSKKTGTDEMTGVRFRIQGDNNVYMNTFTAVYSDGGTTPTDPDDPTYIVEGVWVPTKAFPTAVNTYYISPEGDDNTGDGTEAHPWYNIAVAYAAAQPGDHIVCKGGTYRISKYGTDGKLTVRMNKKGTEQRPIVIRCADGEKPVFDFEQQLLDCNRQTSKVGDRGILLTGDYHIFFGIHITHAADNGMKVEGSHNRIERCEFSYNLDTGLQLGFGHDFSSSFPGVSRNNGTYCAYNDVVDCDSHHNCDCDTNYGSDADGFACKMHNGIGNRFVRCRAWRNSDDAWDLYETDFDVVMAECWAWESGKAEDHQWVKEYLQTSASFSGNGNGIKLGGNGEGGSSKGVHYAFNCISFGHNKSGSVKGFDCNSHKDGHVLVGCLGFDCGYDFMFESGGSDAKSFYYNNVCLGRQEICVGHDDYNALAAEMSKNGWTNHLTTGISYDDYLSLDEDDALLPRDIYGGLPRKFGRLAADSKMIDAGNATLEESMPVWQQLVADFPFLRRTVTGQARDLGPYERPGASESSIRYLLEGDSSSQAAHKAIVGGRLVIDKLGQRYNAIGQQVRMF